MPKVVRKSGIEKREIVKANNDRLEKYQFEADQLWNKMNEIQRAEHCEKIAEHYCDCPQKEAVLKQAKGHRLKWAR